SLFFYTAPSSSHIYTLSYTTLFRSSPSCRLALIADAGEHARFQIQRQRGRASPSLLGGEMGEHARRLLAVAITTSHCARNGMWRSEEHTSELQSRFDLVCRLLLEKK